MAAVSAPLARARFNYAQDPVTAVVATVITVGSLLYPFLDAWLGLITLDHMIPIIIYVLLALGLNIVVGFTGLLDLGYAAFFAIGEYTAAILTSARSPLLA